MANSNRQAIARIILAVLLLAVGACDTPSVVLPVRVGETHAVRGQPDEDAFRPFGIDGPIIFLDSEIQGTVFSVGDIRIGTPSMHVAAHIPLDRVPPERGLIVTAAPPCYRPKTGVILRSTLKDGWQRSFYFDHADVDRDCLEQQAQNGRDSAARVALVIGNSDYRRGRVDTDKKQDKDNKSWGYEHLKSATSEAEDMAATLRTLGFSLVGGDAWTDLGLDSLRTAADELSRAARNAEVVVVYYAGHGLRVDNVNWIVPIGARTASHETFRADLFDARTFLDAMGGDAHRLKILILDACQDDALSREYGAEYSFPEHSALPAGTIVAFAAEPGGSANGNAGENGYERRLAKAMMGPHLSPRELFDKVDREVSEVQPNQHPQVKFGDPLPAGFIFGH